MKLRFVFYTIIFLCLFFISCNNNVPVSQKNTEKVKQKTNTRSFHNRTNGIGNAKILFVSIDRNLDKSYVCKINIDGTGQVIFKSEIQVELQLSPGYGSSKNPRWSSDGKKIVYEESWGQDESHLVLMNEDLKLLAEGVL